MVTSELHGDWIKLWDFNDPAASEARFRDYLTTQSPPPAITAEIWTQIARAQGLQRKFDEAHQTLDRVEASLTADSQRAKIRCLLERGRVFNSSRQPEKACPLFSAALASAQQTGDENLAVDAAHMLGIASPPPEQTVWNLKAMTMAENATDPRARNWLGALYNNIGWTYHDTGKFEDALAIFEKALRWRREKNQVRETQIAQWCVARALRSLNRTNEAFVLQVALKAELQAAGTSDGFVDEELGECLLLLQGEAEAQSHFATAYALLSQDPWLTESEPQRLERLKRLGGV